jgi:hypothetical protein
VEKTLISPDVRDAPAGGAGAAGAALRRTIRRVVDVFELVMDGKESRRPTPS